MTQNFAYVCWQQTEKSLEFLEKFLVEGTPMAFSYNQFNKPQDLKTSWATRWNEMPGLRIELPVFGYKIPLYLYRILSLPAFSKVISDHKIRLAVETDTSIAKFTYKLDPLIALLREQEEEKAADKLTVFMTKFKLLKKDSISSFADWLIFVNQFLSPEWSETEGLEINNLIPLLGVAKVKSAQILKMVEEKEGKPARDTYVRWLSKFASAFKITGCVTDLLNLIYVMYNGVTENHVKNASETELVLLLSTVHRDLERGDWSVFKFVPNLIAMDAEDDDVWSYIFSKVVAKKLNVQEPSCLIQLPTLEETFFDIARRHQIISRQVLFDPASRNGDKLKTIYDLRN